MQLQRVQDLPGPWPPLRPDGREGEAGASPAGGSGPCGPEGGRAVRGELSPRLSDCPETPVVLTWPMPESVVSSCVKTAAVCSCRGCSAGDPCCSLGLSFRMQFLKGVLK